ncbi:transaldolase [Ferrimicrobium sp.]|uniref:transaldolase n=1 Tax=Ferrimicrobium sp. TaxID=2926050 RepID=UPI00260C158D|nr:transaldolase [Ferrimicrobium sp.]
MQGVRSLAAVGQSVWLDSISRKLLDSGTLAHYVTDVGVTGLTSNPSILAHAIGHSEDYDTALRRFESEGVLDAEEMVYELAIVDLTDAAKLLHGAWEASGGRDGYVSIEVPPEYANSVPETISWARRLRSRFDTENVLVKVPGTEAGAQAIRDLIADGIGVNVTLLFGVEHYVAAATAFLDGLELRQRAGLSLDVPSVASVFVSRWDSAANPKLPPELVQTTGLAVMQGIWAAYQRILATQRCQDLCNGADRMQKVLWASTSTKDPAYSDTFYVSALAAPGTINTIPEATLLAFDDHGEVASILGDDALARSEEACGRLAAAGLNLERLASDLQVQGAKSFTDDWNALLDSVSKKLKH